MYDDSVLDKSICRKCINCVRRSIIPLFPEDWIPSDEEIYEEEGEVIMEHEFCTALGIDLDHAVLECSLFQPEQKPDYFIRNIKVFDM